MALTSTTVLAERCTTSHLIGSETWSWTDSISPLTLNFKRHSFTNRCFAHDTRETIQALTIFSSWCTDSTVTAWTFALQRFIWMMQHLIWKHVGPSMKLILLSRRYDTYVCWCSSEQMCPLQSLVSRLLYCIVDGRFDRDRSKHMHWSNRNRCHHPN